MIPDPRRGGQHRRGPALVAFLGLLWPGLGHAALGRARSAAVFGLPLAAVALVVLLEVARNGAEGFAISMLAPSTAITATILVALLGLWRVAAIVDGVLAAGGRPALRRPVVAATVAAAAGFVLVTHVWAGWITYSFYAAGSQIFTGAPGIDATPSPAATASVSGATATPSRGPSPTPEPTPATASDRITILLTGIDSAATRRTMLTDTLIVVSIDPSAKSVSMVSVPRDVSHVRLPDGRRFTGKINSLLSYANRHPDEFPDGGMATLRATLGGILGVPIHYSAAVDLAGFERMIDVVGGVTVDNPRRIADPTYGGWTDRRPIGFFLDAGRHHLDGAEALAYVRSRRGAGDSDFTRASRQQQLLVALGRTLADPAMVPRLPAILEAAADTLSTDFPPDRAGEMVALARSIDDEHVERVVLGPGGYAHRLDLGDGIYRLELDAERVAALSVRLYGEDSAFAEVAG